MKKFTEYSKQLNLSDINKEMLAKWDENHLFEASMTEREGCPSFVFYEGPPSANGMRYSSRYGSYYQGYFLSLQDYARLPREA